VLVQLATSRRTQAKEQQKCKPDELISLFVILSMVMFVGGIALGPVTLS